MKHFKVPGEIKPMMKFILSISHGKLFMVSFEGKINLV